MNKWNQREEKNLKRIYKRCKFQWKILKPEAVITYFVISFSAMQLLVYKNAISVLSMRIAQCALRINSFCCCCCSCCICSWENVKFTIIYFCLFCCFSSIPIQRWPVHINCSKRIKLHIDNSGKNSSIAFNWKKKHIANRWLSFETAF